jgi:hypothetical protein
MGGDHPTKDLTLKVTSFDKIVITIKKTTIVHLAFRLFKKKIANFLKFYLLFVAKF